jgi:hypothetical protein
MDACPPKTVGFDVLGVLKLTDFAAFSVLFVHDDETVKANELKM